MSESKIAKLIEKKYEEYGMSVFEKYTLDDKSQTLLYPEMTIVVKTDDTVLISFNAFTKPEVACLNTLIMKEIEVIKDIKVSDSYVLDNNKNIYCGEEAHEVVKKIIASEAVIQHEKSLAYKKILEDFDGYEC
jgi:hypothetical protein